MLLLQKVVRTKKPVSGVVNIAIGLVAPPSTVIDWLMIFPTTDPPGLTSWAVAELETIKATRMAIIWRIIVFSPTWLPNSVLSW